MANLNTVPVSPVSRSPRGAVRLFGSDGKAEIMTGWESFEVDNNAYRSADTFRVVFSVALFPSARNVDWFSSQTTMQVEILAGLPSDPENVTVSDLDSLIYGDVDEISFDLVRGTVELTGRDFTSKLIDTKSSEHYGNKTASQIATLIATKYGLTPVVTATTKPAGSYYKEDHTNITQMQSEWELLTSLANDENFVLFVKGRELHFQESPSESGDHYIIQWDAPNDDRGHAISNAIDLQFSRSLTIAKGVTVEVHSWNDKQKSGFSAYYPKAARSVTPGQSTGKTQVYKYNIAGLTQETAQQKAQSLYAQIVQHEVRLTAYLPADQILDCTKTLLVQGTETQFDQVYYTESVKRSMSVSDGYRMNIRAKNTSSEVTQ